VSDLEDILSTALSAVASAGDSSALDDVRVKYLGKKGELTGLLKGLGKLSHEERPAAGAEINSAKEALQEAISARKADLDNAAIDATRFRDHRCLFAWQKQ
jgi:phenylalanyl-tRNA synthetase alpha chain